jgi:hypothetical protein
LTFVDVRYARDIDGCQCQQLRGSCRRVGWRDESLSRRRGRVGRDQRGEQTPDASGEVVADPAGLPKRLAGRAGDLPLQVLHAGRVEAVVAAAYGDDNVGGADQLVGPGLGDVAVQVDVTAPQRS